MICRCPWHAVRSALQFIAASRPSRDFCTCPRQVCKNFVSTGACTKSRHFHRKISNLSLGGAMPFLYNTPISMEPVSFPTLIPMAFAFTLVPLL